MSWQDTMRLRRRAELVRTTGWLNALLCAFAAVAVHDTAVWLLLGGWVIATSGLLYAVAHLLDRRATRVVGR